MKTGKTLQELAAEIQRQTDAKKDFVADSSKLELLAGGQLSLGEAGSFTPTEHCHSQIASHLKIPRPYYDRMRTESPLLLAENVNHWFRANPKKRMIRTPVSYTHLTLPTN